MLRQHSSCLQEATLLLAPLLRATQKSHTPKTGSARRGRRGREGRCHHATGGKLFLRQGAGVAVPVWTCSCLQDPVVCVCVCARAVWKCSCLQDPAPPVAKPSAPCVSLAKPCHSQPRFICPPPPPSPPHKPWPTVLSPQALSHALSPSLASGVRQTPFLYNATMQRPSTSTLPLHHAVSIFCACACALHRTERGTGERALGLSLESPFFWDSSTFFDFFCPRVSAAAGWRGRTGRGGTEDWEAANAGWGAGGRETRPGNVALRTEIPGVSLGARLQVDLTKQPHPSPRHETRNAPRR